MKKPMQEAVITASMIAVIVLGGIRMQNKYSNNGVDQEPVEIVDPNVFFSGVTISEPGYTGENNTGIVDTGSETKPLTEMQKFLKIEESDKETVLYPVQLQDTNGEYADRTQMLVSQAKTNMQNITIPKGAKGGYLYVKLRQNLASGRSAVIYVQTIGWNCGGGLKQTGLTYNNDEYLFKLSAMNLVGTGCDGNWFSKIVGKTISIGGYVGSFDGNGIEKITIAWY